MHNAFFENALESTSYKTWNDHLTNRSATYLGQWLSSKENKVERISFFLLSASDPIPQFSMRPTNNDMCSYSQHTYQCVYYFPSRSVYTVSELENPFSHHANSIQGIVTMAPKKVELLLLLYTNLEEKFSFVNGCAHHLTDAHMLGLCIHNMHECAYGWGNEVSLLVNFVLFIKSFLAFHSNKRHSKERICSCTAYSISQYYVYEKTHFHDHSVSHKEFPFRIHSIHNVIECYVVFPSQSAVGCYLVKVYVSNWARKSS